MLQIPQGLQDVIQDGLQKRADVDASQAADVQADAALAAAQAAKQQTAADLAAKKDALNAARVRIDAVFDAFLQVGGTLPADPTPAPVPAPAPAPAA